MSSTDRIDYARDVFGIHSIAPAVIFAVLYAFLLPYYIWRATRNRTYVLIVLSLFCASESFAAPPCVPETLTVPHLSVRVTSFVMRATLAGSEGAAENLGLCIGESIVYSVGFFGLLYSAYILVLDR